MQRALLRVRHDENIAIKGRLTTGVGETLGPLRVASSNVTVMLCALSLLCTLRAYADDPAPAADSKQSTGLGGWLKRQVQDAHKDLARQPVATGYIQGKGSAVCYGDTDKDFPIIPQPRNSPGVIGGTTSTVLVPCAKLIETGAFQRVAAAAGTQGGGKKYIESNDSCDRPTIIKGSGNVICHDELGTQTGLYDTGTGKLTELPHGYSIDTKTGEFIKGGNPSRGGVIRQQSGLVDNNAFDKIGADGNAQIAAIQKKQQADAEAIKARTAATLKARRDAREKCRELKDDGKVDDYRQCMHDLPQ